MLSLATPYRTIRASGRRASDEWADRFVTASDQKPLVALTLVAFFLMIFIAIGNWLPRADPPCTRPDIVKQLEAAILFHDYRRLQELIGIMSAVDSLPTREDWAGYARCLVRYAMEASGAGPISNGFSVYEERRILPYVSPTRVPYLTGCTMPEVCLTDD